MKSGRQDNLLVDGYNVINAWPELCAFKDNLEFARDRLVDIMAHYGAFKDYRVVIVFDAHFVIGGEMRRQIVKGLSVIYTEEGETADSCIEKMAYALVKQGQEVYVATSDGAEQMLILGAGAYRISARELLKDVKRVNKAIKERFTETPQNYRRQELENRISDDVAKRLNDIRRGR